MSDFPHSKNSLTCEMVANKSYPGFPGGSVVKNLPASAGATGATGLIPGSGRSPGGGHGHPLQYSCLENPMDRRALWDLVQSVAELHTTEAT